MDNFILTKPTIHYQNSVEALVHQTIDLGLGKLADNGALCVNTGKFTGRSPENKFIIKDAITADTVDWGGFNHSMDPKYFIPLRDKMIAYLEEQKENLHWWYKNGEKAKEHFAVPYIDYLGKQSLFYVDFVILSKTNVTCLFDTKTAGSDPANAHLKHNALVDFIAERNGKGLKTIGGILIEKSPNNVSTWWYCNNKINNTKDTAGWDMFNPISL